MTNRQQFYGLRGLEKQTNAITAFAETSEVINWIDE